MTDRELLELAAKAVGIKITWLSTSEPRLSVEDIKRGYRTDWNPLTDDGDALRLAVDLDIEVEFISDARICACAPVPETGGDIHQCVYEYTDKHAATRRAIVLAAAEIGREK